MAKLSIRLDLSPEDRIGPGKIGLLEAIAEKGSISGAARAIGMSYRRAWDLVADLNRIFDMPVVATSTGGQAGGRAEITPFGHELIARYRRIEERAFKAAAQEIAALGASARPSGQAG